MGKAAPNTSLPPQATNTPTRSPSQRGKYPFWVPRGPSRLTHLLTSHHPPASRKDINMAEFAVASGDQSLYRSEDIRLDYKNNILKERAEVAHSLPPAKNIDLDKEFRKEYCK